MPPSFRTQPLIQDTTLDFHRGRIEKRCIRVSTELNAYLSDRPLIEQVALIDPNRHSPQDWPNEPGGCLPDYSSDSG